MDFSFSLDHEEDQRQAYRTHAPGLTCVAAGRETEYPVKDISASGLAFLDEDKTFAVRDELMLDLLISHRAYIREIKARVIRVLDNGVIGVGFQDLDRRQEAKLDKLVLEVQKRRISMRKIKILPEDSSPQDE